MAEWQSGRVEEVEGGSPRIGSIQSGGEESCPATEYWWNSDAAVPTPLPPGSDGRGFTGDMRFGGVARGMPKRTQTRRGAANPREIRGS